MIERTLNIIKPDAVARNLIGQILARFEQEGLRIVALKRLHLDKAGAEGFYAVHRQRPFFASLTAYMVSGPVVVVALEGENAITRLRAIMGATDPGKAEPGTIRALHGQSIERNSVHGSDSPDSAAFEIKYFFNALEIDQTA